MKDCNGFKIIGVDHGFGNMKTASHCFPTGLLRYDSEPLFTKDLLVYDGGYYLIGEGHKEFLPDKSLDEDYYVLTLAAIAMELAKLDQIIEEQKLLTGKGIHSVQELSLFQTETEEKIKGLEAERQHCRNQLRRPKSPELTEAYKQKIASATEEMKPLRKELAVAKRIENRWEHLLHLLEEEHNLESGELQKEHKREPSWER